MIATITLREPISDHFRTKRKNGTYEKFTYVVEFGPFAKVFPSDTAAHRWLVKLGFELADSADHYIHKYRSKLIDNIDRIHRKVF